MTGKTQGELWGLFDGLTAIQGAGLIEPYIGTWLEVSGAVASVEGFDNFVQVTLDRDEPSPYVHKIIFFYFDTARWEARLSRLAHGDRISIGGSLDRVDSATIHLEDCELAGGY
jgi:hypothetical protein